MNEPLLPLPLPSPPEHGFGRVLAGAFGSLFRTARAFVRWFRRLDIREPLSRGEFRSRLAERGERERAPRGRKGAGPERPGFPVLPPAEL